MLTQSRKLLNYTRDNFYMTFFVLVIFFEKPTHYGVIQIIILWHATSSYCEQAIIVVSFFNLNLLCSQTQSYFLQKKYWSSFMLRMLRVFFRKRWKSCVYLGFAWGRWWKKSKEKIYTYAQCALKSTKFSRHQINKIILLSILV